MDLYSLFFLLFSFSDITGKIWEWSKVGAIAICVLFGLWFAYEGALFFRKARKEIKRRRKNNKDELTEEVV